MIYITAKYWLPPYLAVMLSVAGSPRVAHTQNESFNATSATEITVDVMSFNIRFNNPADSLDAWPHRKDDVAAFIRFHAPDVVGLQEALIGQLQDLVGALPDYAWVGRGRSPEGPGNEFSAILYNRKRQRILETGTFWLSETPDTPFSQGWDAALPRIATWARFEDAESGVRFLHLNTHFDHRGEVARLESARLIAMWLEAESDGAPVVVTGDFNTLPASPPIGALTGSSFLKDAFRVSKTPHYGPGSTWNGFRAIEADRRIDYIFVNDPVQVQRHAILTDLRSNGRFLSDHLAVMAQVIIPIKP